MRASRQKKPQGVRIIGGEWRGRRLPVAQADTLRPTPDRVRETLFNWLTPYLHGAHCIEPFAGSGILSFEALSRGAKSAWLIEKNTATVQHLNAAKQQLAACHATITAGNSLHILNAPATRTFDIAFIDPPYADNRLGDTCQCLKQHAWLNPEALVYLEYGPHNHTPTLPQGWTVLKEKKAANVNYCLIQTHA